VVAGRIRTFVERAEEPRMTVSVGVAAQQGGAATTDELIALADRAAYRAKFSGRNSVAVPAAGDPVDEAEQVLRNAIEETA
jgi:diguanylate cyclase (GGDEF)-like protein